LSVFGGVGVRPSNRAAGGIKSLILAYNLDMARSTNYNTRFETTIASLIFASILILGWWIKVATTGDVKPPVEITAPTRPSW